MPDPVEGLVAGDRRVGVDAHEVDLVGEMGEVGDHVAVAAAHAALGHGVEVVEVAAAAARGRVLAEPALEPVGVAVALEGVGGAGADRPLDADQLVGLAAALGRVVGEAEVDHHRRAAAEQREVGAGAAIERVVGRPAVEEIAARPAAQIVLAAEALEIVVAAQPGERVVAGIAGEHVVVGGARRRRAPD